MQGDERPAPRLPGPQRVKAQALKLERLEPLLHRLIAIDRIVKSAGIGGPSDGAAHEAAARG